MYWARGAARWVVLAADWSDLVMSIGSLHCQWGILKHDIRDVSKYVLCWNCVGIVYNIVNITAATFSFATVSTIYKYYNQSYFHNKYKKILDHDL